MAEEFTPRDILAGQLAALIPGLPQPALEAAADGLIALGYRQAPVESRPEPCSVLTEDAVVAGANQLRSQLGDFTSPDVLMRKRAKFVLLAALPYLGVELTGSGQ